MTEPKITKAQKAAKAGIHHMLTHLAIGIRIDKEIYNRELILSTLQDIETTIKEYELENNFIADYVEKTYEALIKERRYLDAAAIAKKYGI